jgi:hypothetical protein
MRIDTADPATIVESKFIAFIPLETVDFCKHEVGVRRAALYPLDNLPPQSWF